MKTVPSGRFLAVVNVLIGALMMYGGVLEAVAYWGLRPTYVLAGVAGAVASIMFIASGVAVWMRRSSAGALTAISCLAVIGVHVVSWRMGLLGIPAIVLAIIYPALVLLSLWRSKGSTFATRQGRTAGVHDEKKDGFLKRVAVHVTP